MFGLKLLSEPQEPELEDQLAEAHSLADSLRSDIEAATNDSTAASKRPISGMHDELRATEGEIERLGRAITQRDNLLNWKAGSGLRLVSNSWRNRGSVQPSDIYGWAEIWPRR